MAIPVLRSRKIVGWRQRGQSILFLVLQIRVPQIRVPQIRIPQIRAFPRLWILEPKFVLRENFGEIGCGHGASEKAPKMDAPTMRSAY